MFDWGFVFRDFFLFFSSHSPVRRFEVFFCKCAFRNNERNSWRERERKRTTVRLATKFYWQLRVDRHWRKNNSINDIRMNTNYFVHFGELFLQIMKTNRIDSGGIWKTFSWQVNIKTLKSFKKKNCSILEDLRPTTTKNFDM